MVRRAALGLIALGVKEDDRVAIMAKTRYEWTIIDFALWSVGAIPVPIYDSSSQDQIDWITSDANCSRVFVETAKHAALARAVAAQTDSPLEHVYVIDDGALDDLYKLGEGGDVAGNRAPHGEREDRRSRHHHLHLGHHGAAKGRAPQPLPLCAPRARHSGGAA